MIFGMLPNMIFFKKLISYHSIIEYDIFYNFFLHPMDKETIKYIECFKIIE